MKNKFLFGILSLSIPLVVGLVEPGGAVTAKSVKASSFENDGVRAEMAVDGRMDTRWASKWSDDQWLELDLGAATEIVGLTLYWEAAYGKSYKILLSQNDTDWFEAYQTNSGDGKTDEIFFKKSRARYVKISLTERGSAWGYSLWEVAVKGPEDELKLSASSSQGGSLPEKTMDGRDETAWQSGPEENGWIKIEAAKEKKWGGLLIYWGENFATSYDILVSRDGQSWKKVYEDNNGTGGISKPALPLEDILSLKIAVKKTNRQKGVAIREIQLRKWDEIARPSGLDRTRGLIAWESSYCKTFVGRDGTFGPELYPFQVSFWLWDRAESILYTPQTLPVTWELEEGRLPIYLTKWKAQDVDVQTTLFARQLDPDDLLVNFARTTLKNRGNKERDLSLYVVIQRNPVNPRKGVQELKEIRYDGGNWVSMNRNSVLCLSEKADIPDLSSPMKDLKEWDKVKLLQQGSALLDANGWARGALLYHVTLKPGEEKKYNFIVPSPKPNKTFPLGTVQQLNFDSNLELTRNYWKKRIPMTLVVPDKRYSNAFYSSAYNLLLLKNGDLLYPGPSAYFNFFLHDAVEIAEALDKVGLHKEMAASARLFDYKEGGGYVDELGGNIYALFAHYWITKDLNFLTQLYPRMMDKCRMIQRLCSRQKGAGFEGTAYYGLMPKGVSQDNFTIPAYLYIDDWWALVGLKAAIEAARALNKPNDIAWLTQEYNNLHGNTLESMKKVKLRERVDYFPGFADDWPKSERKMDMEHRILGETQMAWAHRAALYPGISLGIQLPLDDFKKSYQSYWKKAGQFSDYDGGWFVEYEKVFWGYNVKLAHPLLFIGMEELALKNIEWSLNHQSCPGAWMEAMPSRVNEKGFREIDDEAGIIGDVPHGWVAAHYILLLRDMLFREEGGTDGKIILLSCVPESWLANGKAIEVGNAPTYYGVLSFRVESHMNDGFVKITLDAKKEIPKGYLLKSPVKKPIKSVKVDGQDSKNFTADSVQIPSKAKEVILFF